MRVLLPSGGGVINRVVYALVPKQIYVGVSSSGESTYGYYADISIVYRSEDETKALAVVRALDRQHLVPRVYVADLEGQLYVMVVFQPLVDDEIRKHILPSEMLTRVQLAPGTKLVMTAESQFHQEAMNGFRAMFESQGSFRLQIVDHIVEGQVSMVKWYKALHTLEAGWPIFSEPGK